MTVSRIIVAVISTLLLVGCGDSSSDSGWIVGSWKMDGWGDVILTFSADGTVTDSQDAGKNRSPLPYKLNGNILSWSDHKSDTDIVEMKMRIDSRSGGKFSGTMIEAPVPMVFTFTRVAGP